MNHKHGKKEYLYDDEGDGEIDNHHHNHNHNHHPQKPQSPSKKAAQQNKKQYNKIVNSQQDTSFRNSGRLSKIPELYGEDNSQSSAAEKRRAAKMKRYISSILDQPDKIKYDGLTSLQEWAYSVGHLMNDLTSACWFNYLLYWLKQILQFEYASYAMLSGQIADAVTTPLVGYLSDNTETRFGKRMPWYVIGSVLSLIGFLPVFHCFVPGKIWQSLEDSDGAKAFYYIFFPSLFNVGWAAVQISHMSLVPSLTVSRKRRDTLNNKRNTFTFIANLVVLGSALILFQTIQDSLIDFELLGCIAIGIGCISTSFFVLCINEKKLTQDCDKHTHTIKQILATANIQNSDRETQILDRQSEQIVSLNTHIDNGPRSNEDDSIEQLKSWKDWLSEREFYHYAFVYMGCRLYCNIISTMLNFYMVYVLRIASEEEISNSTPMEIALIPLLLFISSVIMSSSLDQLYEKIGKRKIFSIGSLLMILSSGFLSFIEAETGYLMYPIAIIIGCTQVMLLNTGITLISDVIGLKGKSGAFVFGAYSFLDKISTGISLFFISESSYFKSEFFIRWVTVLVPLCSGLFAWFLVATGSIQDIIEDSTDSESEEPSDSEESRDINRKRLNQSNNSINQDDEENENEFENQKGYLTLIETIKKEFAN